MRVAPALRVACVTRLLLVDDPTSGLDEIESLSLLDRLRHMSQDIGCSIVFVTHNIDAAAYVADKICIMQGGTFVEHGVTEEILRRPSHPYTRMLLRAVPHLI